MMLAALVTTDLALFHCNNQTADVKTDLWTVLTVLFLEPKVWGTNLLTER